jgi:hypothetical protein
MLNEMSRSMGQPDFYPFILPTEAVAKLHFIHLVVSSGSWLPDGENTSQTQTQTQGSAVNKSGTPPDTGDPAHDVAG